MSYTIKTIFALLLLSTQQIAFAQGSENIENVSLQATFQYQVGKKCSFPINSGQVDLVTDLSGVDSPYLHISRYNPKSGKWKQTEISVKVAITPDSIYLINNNSAKGLKSFQHVKNQWTGPKAAGSNFDTRHTCKIPRKWGKKRKDIFNFSGSKIFRSRVGMGEKIRLMLGLGGEFPDTASFVHPAQFGESNVLIFASDLAGGYGGMDLYFSTYNREAKSWNFPTNLGPEINSEYDEFFPSLNDNDDLFFSSNDPNRNVWNENNLDLFIAKRNWEGRGKELFGRAKNLGEGINSESNDYGLHWHEGKDWGLFTSDREGNHDIFEFRFTPDFEIKVVDSRTRHSVSGALVFLSNKNNEPMGKEGAEKGGILRFACHREIKRGEFFAGGYHEQMLELPQPGSSQGRDILLTVRLLPDYQMKLKGRLVDYETGKLLENGTVLAIDQNYNLIDSVNIGIEGDFVLQIPEGGDYFVIHKSRGYSPLVNYFDLSSMGSGKEEDFGDIRLKKGGFIMLEGAVVSEDTNKFGQKKTLSAVQVYLFDNNGFMEIGKWQTGKKGKYWIPIPIDKPGDYSLVFAREGLMGDASHFQGGENFPDRPELTLNKLSLRRDRVALRAYHRYDKAGLDIEYMRKVNTVRYTLLHNVNAHLLVESHTDHFGSGSYNLKLSQRRAQKAHYEVVRYDSSLSVRVKTISWGEQRPIIFCPSIENCTPFDLRQNRRTDFTFIRQDGVIAKELIEDPNGRNSAKTVDISEGLSKPTSLD